MKENDKKPTPEEIYYRLCDEKIMNTDRHDIVMEAMQEYAELYHKEKLRGELKAFNNFVLKLEAEGKIPLIDACIEDFIKTKG